MGFGGKKAKKSLFPGFGYRRRDFKDRFWPASNFLLTCLFYLRCPAFFILKAEPDKWLISKKKRLMYLVPAYTI
jgi:hypothetical protein